MARGKIEIKRIDNPTNRQVTYSKRRNGLFKKAEELTVLCDAKVSILMVSSSNKIHEYISPGITTKQVVDLYQKESNTDVWSKQNEGMQETLKNLKDTNKRLRTQIRQRMGECLNDLSFEELRGLEQEMENAVTTIRARKYKAIGSRTDTLKKKVRNVQQIYQNLTHEIEARDQEDRHYGLNPNYQPVNMQSSRGLDLTYTPMSGN